VWAGLMAVRSGDRARGRPPSMTPTKVALARQMYDAQQHSLAEIARTLGVSRASIYRHLARNPADGQRATPTHPR
jgi:DNA invertase Pin-like site-specific DNA recombinase